MPVKRPADLPSGNEGAETRQVSVCHELVEMPTGHRVVLVAVSGSFNHDGEYLATAVNSAADLVDTSRQLPIVLDLRELHYEWGDDMWHLLESADAIVPGPDCSAGLKSLFEEDGGADDWREDGTIFDDVESAIDYLKRAP